MNDEPNVKDGEVNGENIDITPKVTQVNQSPVIHDPAQYKAVDSGMNGLNLFNTDELASAKLFLAEVIKSEKGGIKTIAEGLAVLMRAKDLNLPFSTCIEHIHVINGKTGIDVHIIKALLSRAGCTWELVHDYQPLYEYTDGFNVYNDGAFPSYAVRCINQKDAEQKARDGDGESIYLYPVKWYQDFNGNFYPDYRLSSDKFTVVLNKASAANVIKEKKIPIFRCPSQPIDYITEYLIERPLNGKMVKAIGKFSFNDAVKAEMFTKDTYQKYPKVLIGHRAFTYAAREIASDLLMGCMETTELKILNNRSLNDNDTIVDAVYE